ncbi:helix-turn-helix domain-containing protein [Nocardia iowensis]|uniref:Helix-turn-helix domain-containing protein n=1 Tax=Nocardia iowensis TaxID=204891 RepID=A0ABX8RZK3_NOCIO|nr:helix-turn-helix domain-containing protein [Nocardia iowensis]QXN94277.1 helix-turn-helix domain-containing protein [Nocardia iowensis]
MPGRRLTRTDRQQIASGLAQRLDHAEIARRLGRPTSTVTREVARNGGPGRYRADLAQLAATHRARRKPRPAETPPISENTGPAPEVAAATVRDLTAALIATGVPRTAAGVMACLYTSETGSRTAAELAQHLQVSAATVAHAIRLLEEQGMLLRGHDDNSRRQRYFIDADAGLRTVVASARANQHLAAAALRGVNAFGADHPTGARLAAAAEFLEQISTDIIRSAAHWHAQVSARSRADRLGVPGRSARGGQVAVRQGQAGWSFSDANQT